MRNEELILVREAMDGPRLAVTKTVSRAFVRMTHHGASQPISQWFNPAFYTGGRGIGIIRAGISLGMSEK